MIGLTEPTKEVIHSATIVADVIKTLEPIFAFLNLILVVKVTIFKKTSFNTTQNIYKVCTRFALP